ncbi:MAG: HhH-GPD superfamily base excision repair protein [Proteobacteria bacterium]|nr:HhH-GPD superfamily base excision repair protein [Pseudomonadota bacterium]
MPQLFEYGTVEIAHLQARDPTLGEAIARIGWIERAMWPELFPALVHSLVSQQISNAAAANVWRRLISRVGDLTPARLAQTPLADLRACGVSPRKAEWLHCLSERVRSGALDLAALPALPDAQVIRLLSALPGVGIWTAEMLLIFALGRPDVVSWGDQAIRRGMQRLYGVETLNQARFAQYRERYRPYGTVASFYLWGLAGQPTGTAAPTQPVPEAASASHRLQRP